MTKTPEELTEKWKTRSLPSGWYYIKIEGFNGVDIDLYDKEGNSWLCNSDKDLNPLNVIAPVPTYDEYKAMQKCIANQRAELESARWYHTVQNEDIGELRGLMKECKANYERYISFCKENGCTKGLQEFENFLTRINTALKESEE